MHWLDPTVLPSVSGRVAQFTLNRHGDVDGVLLDDDRQIHVPPHMGRSLARLVAIGDQVEARYVKPRDAAVFAAVSVSNAAGKTVVDDGPHAHHAPARTAPPAHKPMHLTGRVRTTLFAPKGEVCGAVLESGPQLRVDPKGNAELLPYLTAGAAIEVWGEGFKRRGITLVDVHEIAFDGASA